MQRYKPWEQNRVWLILIVDRCTAAVGIDRREGARSFREMRSCCTEQPYRSS
jgi:hypothetical protein